MNENTIAHEEPSPGAGNTFEVICQHCGRLFNACQSAWCECITDNPTLVCPLCHTCFCDTDPEYRKHFWEAAPPGLWQRRLRYSFRGNANPPLEEGNPIRRPLIEVVDDDPNTRLIAFHVLEALGYGVLLAEDGERGFQMARQFAPDLILTDQIMPRCDGKHFCRRIKEDPATRDIRVIVMTGLYKKESQRIAVLRDSHADDFLTKPISFDRLGEILGSWLPRAACAL